MVMDEASCVEVEEEDCSICHTIYIRECRDDPYQGFHLQKYNKVRQVFGILMALSEYCEQF
jgi:hypothetical protein